MAPPKLNYPAAEHHDHDHHHRHPLSFPAVRPCAAISPSTLIASLITLSQTICNFDTNSFPNQRKNARETIRQIAILLVFFQELHHDGGSLLRHWLTDLHVIFQKLHFLMLDCVNEGTRIWMLTKSQRVATEFRVLVGAMASALGMLPLKSIDVSGDIKELVELVTKQGMRGNKFEVDQNDERELKRLRFVVNQFERGIEPDVDAVKQVLNYLGIKSWCACNKEVKFLEQELLDSNEEEEVSLLSSLLGFLCYSRVIIFETIDFHIERSEERCSVEILSCVVPDDFRCPISLEIMTDPVTISTGQTYDRISIQKWLRSGNQVCPKTREKLKGKELFPNTALKKLIQQFCADNGISNAIPNNSMNSNLTLAKTIEPGSSAAAHAVQFTSWFLSNMLVFGTDEQKNKAAYEIRLLARSNVFNGACLVEMGTVPPLLDLLITDDKTTQENAITALMKLSKHNSGKQVIVESRGFNPIVKVLKRGLSLESRHVAAAAVFYLCSVKENRKIIGENAEAITALVELVKDDGTIRNNAVVAILGLLMRDENHSKIIAAGAVPALVNVLGSENGVLVSDSLAVIVALVEGSVEGARAVFKANNNIAAVLSGILESDAARVVREYCASILLALCEKIGDEVTCVLAKELAVSLMPSLYSLLTGGASHATKKARSLVNCIQEFSDRKHYEMVGSTLLFPRQGGVNLNLNLNLN